MWETYAASSGPDSNIGLHRNRNIHSIAKDRHTHRNRKFRDTRVRKGRSRAVPVTVAGGKARFQNYFILGKRKWLNMTK